ncbi:immunoglobulin-like domain-containing protein [Faecalicatena contorta]|uniref:Bacterial Ig-like domain-containing protein n=1 Tax=Faecalicatena contorta TaxID=39482 RepID=A0A315ZP14_9FIRM|nr:immunoglobulin-like domain-containing protein [Faecalicatena contorta]PWJ46414.1 hypothetical protein A8805_1297 [Faecalicatena contorta]SUQ16393.1 hypothetical protein SAMN05216529_1297 [Faecalicatena contorta]
MKKIIGVIVIMVFMLTMAACAQKLDIDNLSLSEYGELKDAGIVMRITDKRVTTETESVMIEYINNKDTEVLFGEEPHLEIMRKGKWYVVPAKEDAAWIDIAYMLPPNGSDKKEFALKFYYENLNLGHYRIVKTFFADSGNVVAAAEFDIQ